MKLVLKYIKYSIIFFLVIVAQHPHPQISRYEISAAINTMQRMINDISPKKENAPQQKDYNDETMNDYYFFDDDTDDHNESDEDMEDIPDDFYDYQEEENF